MLARFSKFLNFENLNFGEREREKLREREREKKEGERGERDGWMMDLYNPIIGFI